MRILRFIANGQMLEPDPECDFTGLVSGTSGYLHAEFEFDNDWIGCRVAASFLVWTKSIRQSWKMVYVRSRQKHCLLETFMCSLPGYGMGTKSQQTDRL